MSNSVNVADDETCLIWDKLCDAVNRNDATIVAKVLQCRKLHSLSIHDPLLCSSQLADQLLIQVENDLKIFSTNIRGEISMKKDCVYGRNISGIKVRALLISPSLYETPWKMCCSFVQFMHQSSKICVAASQGTYPDGSSNMEAALSSQYRSGVTDIQCFLRQVVAVWWDEEKKQTTAALSISSPSSAGRRRSIRPIDEEVLSERNPRYWMLKLVEITADPLFSGEGEEMCSVITELASPRPTSLEDWIMSMELISTIVSLSNDVEQPMLHAVLDLLFHPQKRKVHWDSLVRWIGLATEISSFLREKDWKTLHGSVQDALYMDTCPIPTQHWPSLVENLFTVSMTRMTGSISSPLDWLEIIMELFLVATRSSDVDVTYREMEAKLHSCLSSLPPYSLREWASQFFALSAGSLFSNGPTDSSNFKFIQANVALQIWSSTQRFTSLHVVSRLVARAFDASKSSSLSSGSGSDLSATCWKHVMHLTLDSLNRRNGSLYRTSGKPSNDPDLRRQEIAKALRDLFDDVRYAGQGIFCKYSLSIDETALSISTLTNASSFVRRSLFLDSHGSPSLVSLDFATKRAQLWLQCVNENALYSQLNDDYLDFAVAIIVLVTVYVEIPRARSFLVRNMLNTLKATFTANMYLACVAYTMVITVVTASSSHDSAADSQDMMSSLDVISELLAQPLPFEIYCDLARALAPLPSGRLALLSNVQKRFVERSSHTSRKATMRPIYQRSHEAEMCCLFALIQLIQIPTWNDIEITSWLILSDLIIENREHLPPLMRTWLFQELKGLVVKGKFSEDVCNHLLRGCLIRLLLLLRSPEDHYRTYIDDIICIFDLIFTLIYYELLLINDGEKVGKCITLNRCIFILSNWIGAEYRESKLILEDVELCDDVPPSLTNDLDESSICIVGVFYCLSLALRSNCSERISFDKVILPSDDEFIQLLLERERKELGIDRETHSSSPWFIACSHTTFGGNVATEGEQFINISPQIRLSLYDVVISLLMGPKWWINAWHESIIPSRQSLMSSAQLVSAFMVKRRLSDTLDDLKDRVASLAPNCGPVFRSFLGFCTFVVPVLKQNITSQQHFVLTNEMLASILDLCDPLSLRYAPSDSIFSLGQRLECFYNLYSSVAEEKSCIDLIRYLECCCRDGGVMIRSISLRVPDDINCFVRRLRTSIFRCLANGIAECIHTSESDCQKLRLGNEKDITVEYSFDSLIRFIKSLSVDINVGLSEGLSGGLTHDLYVSIIDSMGQFTKMVLKSLKSEDAIEFSSLSSLVSVCISVSNGLEGVLCNFSLHQATALKKTLQLCAGTLPAVIRWARRHSSFSGNYSDTTSFGASELFEQLSNILKSKAEFVCVKRTSWDIVAGSEHIGGIRYLSDSDDEVSELSDGFTDVVKSQRLLPEAVDHGDNVNVKLLLRSERSWIWSLCSLLEVFEDDWSESYSLIQSTTEHYVCDTNMNKHYVDIRQKELALTIKAVGQVFQGTKSLSSPTRNDTPVASVNVLHMPSSAKLKLCGAVDRIIISLQKSIKLILLHVQADFESLASIASSLSFLEAFSCLYAWLCVCVKSMELCAGVQKWYKAEKAAGVSRNEDENYVEDVSVMTRLPKLFFRCEELVASLQHLSQVLQLQVTRSKRSESSPFLTTVDNWISTFPIGVTGSFRELVSKKLAFLKEEQLQVECDFGLLSPDDKIRRKNRKRAIGIAKRMKRERRHKLVRSRNFVVDSWLQADRVTGEDEVLDDDAYADLEDFLVDG